MSDQQDDYQEEQCEHEQELREHGDDQCEPDEHDLYYEDHDNREEPSFDERCRAFYAARAAEAEWQKENPK